MTWSCWCHCCNEKSIYSWNAMICLCTILRCPSVQVSGYCPDDITWTVKHIATKLGVLVHHLEQKSCWKFGMLFLGSRSQLNVFCLSILCLLNHQTFGFHTSSVCVLSLHRLLYFCQRWGHKSQILKNGLLLLFLLNK